MFRYLISFNVIIVFLIALLFTFFFDKRHPYLCYCVWSLFLLKLLVPWGFHEISFFNPLSGIAVMLVQPSIDLANPPYGKAASTYMPSLPVKRGNSFIQSIQDRIAPVPPRISANQNFTYGSIYTHKFILFWLLISFLVIIREIHSTAKLLNVLRHGSVRDKGDLYDLFGSCSRSLLLPSVPKLVVSQRLTIPFSFGLCRRQYVVIPETYESKSGEDLQIIFCHELAHLKKHDTLINLLRTLCLILFHIHPFRIVADFLVYRYQEITSDLLALKTLRIDHEKYLNVLIKEFVFVRDRSLLLSLSSSLSLNNVSFFQRLRYIKGYTPLHSNASTMISGLTLVFTLFIASSNVSFSGANSNELDLLIDVVDNQSNFPSPIRESSPISTHQESYPILTDEYLTVVEPYQGFRVYRLQELDLSTPLLTYSLPGNTPSAGKEKIRDVKIYQDRIYVAIGNENGFSFEFSRIEIMQWTESGEIIEVGKIEQNHPRMLQIVGNRLWVAGSGEDIYEGSMWIYDLNNPDAPEALQTIYLPYFPSVLMPNSEGETVYTFAFDTVYVFQSKTGLDQPLMIQPPYQPIRLAVMADNTLVINGVKKDPMGNFEHYLLLYKWEDGTGYDLAETYRLVFPPNSASSVPVDMLGWDRTLLLTFSPTGMALFKKEDRRLKLVQYERKDHFSGDLNQDHLIFLFPQTGLYRKNDFLAPLSLITSWSDYEYVLQQPQG